MLVDSFDKKTYAPTLPFEKKTDAGQRNFKSILRNSSETSSGTARNSSFQETKSPIQEFNSQPDNIVDESQKIHLGTLSDDTPTVSELIYSTSYKKKCWEMLERNVNSSKHFKQIPAGTDIYLDKETSEIVWKKSHGKNNVTESGAIWGNSMTESEEPSLFTPNSKSEKRIQSSSIKGSGDRVKASEPAIYKFDPAYKKAKVDFYQSAAKSEPALNEAVQEFMGKKYSKMDCYELVVGGLKKMGVKYLGKGGLGRHLIDKAVDQGLARNHYLNGEGLVEATGYSVYHKALLSIKNPLSQAESAMKEMEKVLREGQILSFSTRTRGHTGVISKKSGIWTFINSGYMDNNIAGKNGEKKVGEEILSKELENWFKLAGSRKEGLKITLGDIDLSKLSAYRIDKAKPFKKV